MRHRILTGELSLELVREALDGQAADIVYSDPPWGPGNLRYWRTMNGERLQPSWPGFLDQLCSVIVSVRSPCAPVFIEMGCRWIDELDRRMAAHGLRHTQILSATYGSRPSRPSWIWYHGSGIQPPRLAGGIRMVRELLQLVSEHGELVLDPCCGKGTTARVALQLGLRFAGVELNDRRAEEARRWCYRYETRVSRS